MKSRISQMMPGMANPAQTQRFCARSAHFPRPGPDAIRR